MTDSRLPRFGVCALFLVLALSPSFAAEHPVTLWEVQGKHNRIFLLGSIHLLRPSDYPIPGVIYDAYDEAETLIMELDMDDLDPKQTQALVQELGIIQQGRTLQDKLGRTSYAKARRLAGQVEIPLESLNQLEPWLAAVSIETILMTRIGFEIELGIESHLMIRATNDNKEILGLETERQQFEMLDSLSPAAQREMLLQTLTDGAEIEDVLDSIIDAWRHGDTAFLETSQLEDMAQSKELYQAIVIDRNRNWAAQIDTLLDDDDDYLIIVGTLHLVGENGVPNLLRTRGHSVQQMQQQ